MRRVKGGRIRERERKGAGRLRGRCAGAARRCELGGRKSTTWPSSYFKAAPGSAATVTVGGVKAAQITSSGTSPYGYGGVSVSFPATTTFSQLTTLSTSYNMTQGTCVGGAPRFQLDLADAGGMYIGTLVAYIGPGASLNGDPCPAANNAWATQPNVATSADPATMRWDFQACTGTCPGDTPPANNRQSWAVEQTALGGFRMTDAQIVVDAGWATTPASQQMTIENWNVNGKI